jgi:hypothetical protein
MDTLITVVSVGVGLWSVLLWRIMEALWDIRDALKDKR